MSGVIVFAQKAINPFFHKRIIPKMSKFLTAESLQLMFFTKKGVLAPKSWHHQCM